MRHCFGMLRKHARPSVACIRLLGRLVFGRDHPDDIPFCVQELDPGCTE
jgi:hypothetical protein